MNEKEINANGYEYVDLGLPSGTLWATCNVGATKPEEYGLYFQWGDIVGYTGDDAKVYSTWETAPFNWGMSYYNPDFERLKKLICPKGILLPKYDAAHVHMRGGWRMPTREQFKELLYYTKHKWVTANGVNGRKFTSWVNPSNYIFIPASGGYYSGSDNGDDEWTDLWSSSLNESGPYFAWKFYFDEGSHHVSHSYHCYGFCVRGVIG